MQLQARNFISFDGSTRLKGFEIRPEQYSYFQRESLPDTAQLISRGAGLSYAAASFGANVCSVDQANFDRILAFNKQEKWVEVEAGISLGQLYDFLIQHNLFLATQPGHPRITVGGCVAPDIHGKNQFMDGTCINQVLSLKLFHPTHGVIELSPENNEALFRLTCGAYGLTGNIISCKLKVKEIPSNMAEVTLHPINRIEDLLPKLKSLASQADFLFSWHDFNVSGDDFGKGFVQEGRFLRDSGGDAQTSKHKRRAAAQTLNSESRGALPFAIFNPLSVKLMNMLYGAKGSAGSKFSLELFDSIFPIQNSKELYFKFFGNAGFHEYQVVVPENKFLQYVDGIKARLKKFPVPITLASAKLFKGKQDLLRFTGDGICFAINFSRSSESQNLIESLDELLISCNGIPNIIKDSRLSARMIAACYPDYDLFRARLQEFDPRRLYKSELSERLSL